MPSNIETNVVAARKEEKHSLQSKLAADLFIAIIANNIDVDSIDQQEAAMSDAMDLAEEFFQLYKTRYL